MKQGIMVAIIDGPCIYKDKLAELNFPVWSKGVSKIKTRLAYFGGCRCININCGGVIVSAGNAVLTDENGVCFLPPDQAKHVVQIAVDRFAISYKERYAALFLHDGQNYAGDKHNVKHVIIHT